MALRSTRSQGAIARAIVCLLIVTGCAGGATTSPDVSSSPTAAPAGSATVSPAISDVPGALGEALGYVGPIPRSIGFTDWAAIRAAAGAKALTGASAFEDKAVAIRDEFPAAASGLEFMKTHAADWGFDVFDLDWEVEAAIASGFIHVLRFRDGFDLATLSSKLDAYDFEREDLTGGVLWTGTAGALLGRSGALYLMNSGILADARTVVASTSGDPVRAILTDGPIAVADPSLRSVARLLGEPATAMLVAGGLCEPVREAMLGLDPQVRSAIDEQLAGVGPLAQYNAAAIGYGRDPETIGVVVLGYAVAGQAEADLAGRRRLAEEGYSLTSRPGSLVRYTDRYFAVRGAHVQEHSIVIELTEAAIDRPSQSPGSAFRATEFMPRNLMSLATRRDLLFASCTP